jgi:hypothetical protein
MPYLQRYISKELTHFLGRELLNDEERYKLLVKILKERWITHPPHENTISGNLMVNLSAQVSNNEMFNPQCICFCDIPISDIDIHTRKYSRFGLAFLKDFLAPRGASPVFYIANNSIAYINSGLYRGEYFDISIKEYHEFVAKLRQVSESTSATRDKLRIELTDKFNKVEFFLHFTIFSFLKFFDNTLSEDNEKNYYMEREWRIIGNLNFELKDVYRVILPSEFTQRLRRDVPEYAGQVTFSK